MKTYSVETYDNVIPDEFRKEIWDYIQNQSFHATRKNVKYPDVGHIIRYRPADKKYEYMTEDVPSVNNQYMHRTVFGDNEEDLQKDHPIILELWNSINKHLSNKFIIDGDMEGIADTPPRLARVYVNAQPEETIKRSHGIHRDTIDLSEENHYTLLYIANPEWYPTWFGENVFYESDDDSLDKQQYQKGFGQARGFGIGEPYAVIAPKPGRIILYDGRTPHTTRPTAIWAQEMRKAVVFRIKKVK